MSTEQKKNYALPIIVMFALFAMISFVTGLQNPMGVIVKSQFGASNFMSQLGNAANFIAYAFMGIPAGMLLQRIGYKKTALLAVTVGFYRCRYHFLVGYRRKFRRVFGGRFHFRFFHVYVEYGSESYVEYSCRRWKQRKSIDSIRWFVQLD